MPDKVRARNRRHERGTEGQVVGREAGRLGVGRARRSGTCKPKKYGIVKDLVGHGVGHAVRGSADPTTTASRVRRGRLPSGMVVAIEADGDLGLWRVNQLDDGWTIVTADGSLAAHFEATIAIAETGIDS